MGFGDAAASAGCGGVEVAYQRLEITAGGMDGQRS